MTPADEHALTYLEEPLAVWRRRWMDLPPSWIRSTLVPGLCEVEAYEAAAVASDVASLLEQCGAVRGVVPERPLS